MSRPENAVGTRAVVEATKWKVQKADNVGEGECESGGIAVVDVDGVENVSKAWASDHVGACLS